MRMLIEVECDGCACGKEDMEWLVKNVLMNQTDEGALYLHSNEIGDTVGRVRVLAVNDVGIGGQY